MYQYYRNKNDIKKNSNHIMFFKKIREILSRKGEHKDQKGTWFHKENYSNLKHSK